MKILAIETSCDETAVAVVEDGRNIITNQIYTQIDIHKKYGGVVPEIASRNHVEKLPFIIDAALKDAALTYKDIDAVAVTSGPGLVGALLIGVSQAKAMAYALNKPLIAVHHIEGHIAANYLQFPDLEPPFLSLVVSGGHSHLIMVKDYTEFEVIGKTLDDAAGEAFDKISRVLGLGYPGGPAIDKAAKYGNPEAVDFPRIWLEKNAYNFSFSGLKSAVLNHINNRKMKGQPVITQDIAASFQAAVVEVLTTKAIDCALHYGVKKLGIAGGVAANSALRDALSAAANNHNIKLYYPNMTLCTDNAAMIGAMAYYNYKAGKVADAKLNAIPNLKIGLNAVQQ